MWLQKEYKSKGGVIELKDLDREESYCVTVQAYIPSRRPDKQKGEMSQMQCSGDDDQSFFGGERKWTGLHMGQKTTYTCLMLYL